MSDVKSITYWQATMSQFLQETGAASAAVELLGSPIIALPVKSLAHAQCLTTWVFEKIRTFGVKK
jgi:hypothetical protein